MKEAKKQKDRIVTIDERHHVIDGILVDLSPGIYNLDDPEDRKKLIADVEQFQEEQESRGQHAYDYLWFSKVPPMPGDDIGIHINEGRAEVYIKDFAEKIDRSLAEKMKEALDEYQNKTGDNV